MPSQFDELMCAYVEPHVDDLYGEPFRLTPMRRTPNGRPGPDPDRTVIEGIGVFEDEPVDVGVQTGDRKLNSKSNDLRTVRTTNQPSLSVLLSYFPAPDGRPRQGDVIEIEAGRFDVISVQPDGAGRIDLQLVRAGSATSDQE